MLLIPFIVVLLIINVVPITKSVSPVQEHSRDMKGCCDLIHISGMMGNDGWYVSDVQIIIHPPPGIGPVYYRINDMDWCEYITPIIVDSDGLFTIYVSYIDEDGDPLLFSADFKIDKTPPYVTVTIQRDGYLVLVSVIAEDVTSGVVFVEFYLDGMLIGNCTVEPYEFSYKVSLFTEHTSTVIVYDAAGNSASVSHTFPFDLHRIQSSFYQQCLRASQNLILLHHLIQVLEGNCK
jgi:hypothetical protein